MNLILSGKIMGVAHETVKVAPCGNRTKICKVTHLARSRMFNTWKSHISNINFSYTIRNYIYICVIAPKSVLPRRNLRQRAETCASAPKSAPSRRNLCHRAGTCVIAPKYVSTAPKSVLPRQNRGHRVGTCSIALPLAATTPRNPCHPIMGTMIYTLLDIRMDEAESYCDRWCFPFVIHYWWLQYSNVQKKGVAHLPDDWLDWSRR